MVCGAHPWNIVLSKNSMEFTKISQHAQKFFTRLKRGYQGDISPERDWFVLLALAGVLLLISITMNAISFARVYEGEPISPGTNTNPDVRETEELANRLKNIEAAFSEREKAFEAAITNPYPFVDPARN